MNIVVFSPSWPQRADANGIVTYCANIVPALREKGHNVYVLTGKLAGEKDAFVYELDYQPTFIERKLRSFMNYFNKGYQQYYFGASAILAGIKKIQRDHKVDILEIEESFGWHYYLQKHLDFPVVMRLHGPHYVNGTMGNKTLDISDLNRFKREKRAFKAARYVNAPCQWVLDSVKDKYGITWPLEAVFYNPIQVVKREDCWASDTYVRNQILFVGRFDSHKGGDIVIKAFAQVLKKIPDAILMFVGPDRGVEVSHGNKISIVDMIAEHIPKDKQENIHYLGLIGKDKILALRKASHVTVMASRNENFPYTVLESLASSSPVIASHVGGIAEVFEDGISGLYFKGSDIEDFAEKIISLLSDNARLKSLSENAYTRCMQAFSPDTVADEALRFYAKAIKLHVS